MGRRSTPAPAGVDALETMRWLILTTIFCCAAWPCAANLIEPIPPQWAWPPAEIKPEMPPTTVLALPPALVSATYFRLSLSDDLRHDPVPAIGEGVSDESAEVFPAVLTDDVPLPRPRVELVVRNVPIEEVCETLADAAEAHRLPLPFFIRLIWQESRFDPRAVSPVGAQGMAQFMPETAAAMGLRNPFDPLEALRFSARLLRELLGQFGNLGLAAAAYNAGPKRILDWLAKRGKLPEETRDYVRSITGHPAERWRVTRPGRLALEVPKRAPCKAAHHFAHVVEVPAPVPVPVPKPRARMILLAKEKSGDHKAEQKTAEQKAKEKAAKRKTATASHKKAPADVSAARKQRKTRAKPKPAKARTNAADRKAKQSRN